MDTAEKELEADILTQSDIALSTQDNQPEALEPLPDLDAEDIDFSLNSLIRERDQEQGILEREPGELDREIAKMRRASESSLIEPRSLARALTVMGVDESVLKSYLESKKDVFAGDPKELARGLMYLESKIIAPLSAKLQAAKIPDEQANDTLESAREAFYGIVLNQRLSPEQIINIFNGEIIIKQTTGDEVDEKYRNVDIYSYINFDESTNKFNIYIYNNFFKEKGAGKAFLLRHEFAHAAAFSIWGKRYTDFLEAAKNPHAAANNFKNEPELREVLLLLANPQSSKLFFRGYISELLEASTKETDPQKVMELRSHAAQEIVADMTAHYLEGSSSSASLIDFRKRYFNFNNEQLFDLILKAEDVSKEELIKRYKLFPGMTPDEIAGALSESDRLAGLFRLSTEWQKALQSKLNRSGKTMTATFSSASALREQGVDVRSYCQHPENYMPEEFDENRTISPNAQATAGPQASISNAALELWNMFAK